MRDLLNLAIVLGTPVLIFWLIFRRSAEPKTGWKLFGMSSKTLVLTLALGIAVMLLVSVWFGLLVVMIFTGAIQYRDYREDRAEAAYEVTENGTRQLWNDGPKMVAGKDHQMSAIDSAHKTII